MIRDLYKLLKYIMLNQIEKEEKNYNERHILDKME
jgi:hypothetical protein